jgi:shikimate dehydrogenase
MIRACCIGWPIEHVRSPIIHNHWVKELGISGQYTREGVRPEDFATFFRSLADRGYAGCNVTLPHKEAAFALLDEVDPAAVAVGAVNTVWVDGGRLVGMNSDVPGFIANLDEEAPGWDSMTGHAVVIGAGGAARGIVYGLIERGVEIVTLANRSVEKAEQIARQFPSRVKVTALDDLSGSLAACDLLVNTTSLGMTGQPPLAVDLDRLKPGAIVSDIVYVPLVTDLLRRAADRGHPTVGGLGMLLHQAVPGFERWFGVRPTVTAALYDLVAADIGAH